MVTTDGVDYSDWYLPSIYELLLLATNFGTITEEEDGGLAPGNYWSSTEVLVDGEFQEEHSAAHAWMFDVTPDIAPESRLLEGVKSNTAAVRAIRAF